MTKHFDTRVIHAGNFHDPLTGAVIPPIYVSSTYTQESPGENKGYFYARMQNPTRFALENALADLEGATRAFAFASGMAAEAAILELLPANSHIIASGDLYGGTLSLFNKIRKHSTGLSVTYTDSVDFSEVDHLVQPNTRMLWAETPTNPLLVLTDLAAAANFAKHHNLISVVDSTFASPALQRPLEFGFDIVMHSTTKFMGGHSDVIGGAVIARNDELGDKLSFIQETTGAIASPFDCFLVLRGLKTLALRMERHCSSAMKIAEYMSTRKGVAKVIYPGLVSHPQHELAKRQMRGFGGVVSIELEGGLDVVKHMLDRLKIFAIAVSLGGVESLVSRPAGMSHASIAPDERNARGITDGLLRFSIGIENVDDLIADLDQALNSAT